MTKETKEADFNPLEYSEEEYDTLTLLQKAVDKIKYPAVLCEIDRTDMFNLKMVYCNDKFTSCFNLKPKQLAGRDYSFLFRNVDIGSHPKNQAQYGKLQKSVKNLQPASVAIEMSDVINKCQINNFRINFNPDLFKNEECLYATFTFKKLPKPLTKTISNVFAREILIKDLQKALQNERLLRKVSDLVISDEPINEIAGSIAQILCNHLKVDRCILHDYSNGKTGFLSEYHNEYTASMLGDGKSEKDLQDITSYINFQKHLYEGSDKIKADSCVAVYENINNNYKSKEIEEICERHHILAQISMITTVNNKVNGGVYIHQSSTREWLAEELDLIEVIAEQFAVAIDRSHSIDKVILANNQLLEKTLELRKTLKEEKRIRQMQNEFVAMVSHEFKTPLQIIDSTRELVSIKLKKFSIEDLSVDKYLAKIKNAIVRMNSLIQSSLNLARIEMSEGGIEPEMNDFGIKNLITEIVEKNNTLASEKNIQVVVELNDLPDFYRGDAKMLDHCFTNVITNAIKYSKNNFPVKVVGGKDEKSIFVKVIDSGIGIPKEDIANVGRKFFRAKNTLAVSGTGIGLYLTKYFVELHHGEVKIESVLDVGTTATITLPITKK